MRRLLVILAALCVLPLAAQNADDAQQFQKLVQVFRYLSGLYVDEVDMKPVVEGAIAGMLEELDPHSAYIGAEEMKGVQESFDGEFSGIGVEFNVLRDSVIVVNTIAGGPAERVGVRANDRIVRIDTLDAVGMGRADVPKYLRGKSGTKVEIEVVRHGTPGRLHFVIVRDKIPLNTVDAAYMAGDGIGYIKVNRFGRTTMNEFTDAYRKLGEPRSLILDLRGNGGGLLEQAVEMAGFFLPRGAAIVSTEGRAVPAMTFRAQSDGTDLKGRLAVLIDEASASASEIVAGAVQDWDRVSSWAVRASAKGWCSGRSGCPTVRPCASPWPVITPPRGASSSVLTSRANAVNITSTTCAATTMPRATPSTPGLRPTVRCARAARSTGAAASVRMCSSRPIRRDFRITTPS